MSNPENANIQETYNSVQIFKKPITVCSELILNAGMFESDLIEVQIEATTLNACLEENELMSEG